MSELHLLTKTERPHIIGIKFSPKNHNRQIHQEEFILDRYEMLIHSNVNKSTEATRRRSSDPPSTLDLIVTNEEHMIDELNIEALLGNCDHSILKFKCTMESKPPKLQAKIIKGNYNKFNQLIGQIDWKSEFDKYPNDINIQWKLFRSKYIEAEKSVPHKMVYVDRKLAKKFSVPLDRTNLKKLQEKTSGEKLGERWHQKRKNEI